MTERDIRSLQRERRRLGRTIRSLKRQELLKRDQAAGKKRGGFGFVLLLMLIAVIILWYWFFYLRK